MGQTINCPTCGMLFVVPTVAPAAIQAVDTSGPAAAPRPETEEGLPDLRFRKRPGRRFAHLDETAVQIPASDTTADVAIPDFGGSTRKAFDPVDSGPRLVHIACPQGHELVTPLDTMGQDVLCPHCGEQFTMRYEDTREYQAEHYWKEEARQQKLGQQWLTWAVIVGVLVLVMFIGMIIFTANK